MTNRVMVGCLWLVAGASQAQELNKQLSPRQEEKILQSMFRYVSCLERAQQEKEKITSGSYEYIKERCQTELAHSLKQIEEHSNK